MGNLLLIDGFNLLSRGYYATAYGKDEAQLPKNEQGAYINALRVFIPKIVSLINNHNITHLAVAWDVKREESDRRKRYSFYKETRNALPNALIQQFHTLKEILANIGIQQLEISPYEADDVIGALSKKWDFNTFIYSNDKDLLQLLSPTTTQIIAQKYGEILYGMEQFQEDYGISPTQWIDVKALLGDNSDNIPGCPGVGEKSALPLIQHYESVEALYEQIEQLDTKFNRYKKKLIAGQELAFISKELATITTEIPELNTYNLDDFAFTLCKETVNIHLLPFGLRIKI